MIDMKAIHYFRDCLLIAWMIAALALYILVTVPAEGRLLSLLPSLFWQMRDMVYPFFYSPSLY